MLVVRNSVSEDFIVPNTVLIYSAAIAGVAFNGIDNTALNLLIFLLDFDVSRIHKND